CARVGTLGSCSGGVCYLIDSW
nr:immunoglobulin heavy chain junction region [Macaca mulatta]MOV58182.1 immunoglobulin heavy chain junction region [Macaca mulatta]